MGKLEGKVAVVTGGASGIGEAIVRLFVGEGAQTIIADILDRPGGALAEELGQLAFFQHTDVSQESDVQEAFRKATGQFGKIDILVNNARAEVVYNATQARQGLLDQIASPVLWEQSIRKLVSLGVERFVEVGPGRVLSGLLRQIERSIPAASVEDRKSLEKTLAALSPEVTLY